MLADFLASHAYEKHHTSKVNNSSFLATSFISWMTVSSAQTCFLILRTRQCQSFRSKDESNKAGQTWAGTFFAKTEYSGHTVYAHKLYFLENNNNNNLFATKKLFTMNKQQPKRRNMTRKPKRNHGIV